MFSLKLARRHPNVAVLAPPRAGAGGGRTEWMKTCRFNLYESGLVERHFRVGGVGGQGSADPIPGPGEIFRPFDMAVYTSAISKFQNPARLGLFLCF